jgi:hypothetical protein
MNIEKKIIAARPHDAATNKVFVEAVRAKITSDTTKRQANRLITLLRRNPALALLAVAVVFLLISGTVYAVSYLWPKLYPRVSVPEQTSSGRTAVIVTDCDKADTYKKYELKAGAPISNDKLSDAVKAQCELTTVSDWSSTAYPHQNSNSQPDNRPGSVIKRVTTMPAAFAVKLIRKTTDRLTVADSGSLLERDIVVTSETKVVIDGKYAQLQQLQAGDSLTYVLQSTITAKNQPDCTNTDCHADIVSSTDKTLVIIKLKYDFDVYRAVPYLSELPMCAGNLSDECPAASSVDVYQRLDATSGRNAAEIAGKVTTYSDQAITLSTTSGREVTVHTPWNLISRYNASRPSGESSIGIGDTLSVTYGQADGTANDTEIPVERVAWVRLLMESNGKAGPYHKY